MDSNALEKFTNNLFLDILCTYSFYYSTNRQNMRNCGLICPKNKSDFSREFSDYRLDMIEKHRIINLSSYISKGYTSVIRSDSEVTFLRERVGIQPFFHFSIVFCLHTTLHNQILSDSEVTFLQEGWEYSLSSISL